jgi:hypothetical protein
VLQIPVASDHSHQEAPAPHPEPPSSANGQEDDQEVLSHGGRYLGVWAMVVGTIDFHLHEFYQGQGAHGRTNVRAILELVEARLSGEQMPDTAFEHPLTRSGIIGPEQDESELLSLTARIEGLCGRGERGEVVFLFTDVRDHELDCVHRG